MEHPIRTHSNHSAVFMAVRTAVVMAVLCAGAMMATAQTITLPDTVRMRAGERTTIAVTGAIDVAEQSDVSIDLSFTPSTLRPVAAAGSALDGFGCSLVTIRGLSLTNSRFGQFALYCDSVRTVRDGRICTLTLEGLPGDDTVGTLRVQGIMVNGIYQPIDDAKETVVLVTGGVGIRPNTTEGISGNFPNPFSATTRIEYVITTPGIVAMEIRDLRGGVFHTFEPVYHNAGTHTLEYRPKIWEMSSGHYLLRMTTPSGTYLHTMTVEK